jgi:hypothetical protein
VTYRVRPIKRLDDSGEDGFTLAPPEFKFAFKTTEDRLRPVRCVDGFARPKFQCRQFADGSWISRFEEEAANDD